MIQYLSFYIKKMANTVESLIKKINNIVCYKSFKFMFVYDEFNNKMWLCRKQIEDFLRQYKNITKFDETTIKNYLLKDLIIKCNIEETLSLEEKNVAFVDQIGFCNLAKYCIDKELGSWIIKTIKFSNIDHDFNKMIVKKNFVDENTKIALTPEIYIKNILQNKSNPNMFDMIIINNLKYYITNKKYMFTDTDDSLYNNVKIPFYNGEYDLSYRNYVYVAYVGKYKKKIQSFQI